MTISLGDYEPKDIIYIIREWTGLSQANFGKSINKSRRMIQEYEAGKSRYYITTLLLISKVHNVEIKITKK